MGTINKTTAEINAILDVAEADKNRGFWDVSTNTPDYAVELTLEGYYLVVGIGGDITIQTIDFTFAEGDYLLKTSVGYAQIRATDPKFTGFTDGDFLQVIDGTATKADIRQLDDTLLMGETTRNKQGSIGIGPGTTLSEYGGLFTTKSTITGSSYFNVLSQYKAGTIDLFGSQKARRLEIGTSGDVVVQGTDTTELVDVTSVTYESLAYLHEVTKFYLDFANTPTNFRFRIKRADNDAVIKYFPNEFAWLDEEGGVDITSTGKQEVYPLGNLNGTPLLLPESEDYIFEMAADTAINLNGSVTLPYLKVEAAPAEFIELADDDDLLTLESGDTTQESLDLTNHELKANLAAQLSDGVMSKEDKLILDNISSNCGGDSWVSGLQVVEASPKDQTADYGAGVYLINGVEKTIASSGNYDLENAYGSVDHYLGMVDDQHAIVIICVDDDEVIKSYRGDVVEKGETAFAPLVLDDTVCVAAIEIKVDKNDNPKDIGNKQITDTRHNISINTDMRVAISADDLSEGFLSDKLSNNGNVEFTIENAGGEETLKADASLAPIIIEYTTNAHIDGIDVSIAYPVGILMINTGSNREIKSFTGGLDGQILHIVNADDNDIKYKHQNGTYQKLRVEGKADKTQNDYGGATLVYNGTEGYWYVIGIIT